MGNYDDHPGKGQKEVRGYHPPAGTHADVEKSQRLEEDRKDQKKHHDEMMKATSQGGAQKKSNGGSCWIATAYYGDPWHPEVERLRDLRDHLRQSRVGPLVGHVNTLYYTLGETRFGQWWKDAVEARKRLPTAASCSLLSFLQILSKVHRKER